MIVWGGATTGGPINSGGIYCTASASPGTIPDNDNTPGTPLTISKSGTDLVLNWSAPGGTCQTQDYGIYRGALPFTGYNHASIQCSTAGSTTASIASDVDNYYYLVVAQNNSKEGSYGLDSSDTQRPAAASPCFQQELGTCN